MCPFVTSVGEGSECVLRVEPAGEVDGWLARRR